MQSASDVEKITKYLPDVSFPMTFSWVRFYEKENLVQAFNAPVLEIYQARISLTSVVTAFEVALDGFINHLVKKGCIKEPKNQKSVKHCIEWSYNQLFPCYVGEAKAVERLPETFGIIDNARRLRNLIIHNQGLFDEGYEKDIIKFRDIKADMHPDYSIYKANPQKPTPAVFGTAYFLRFSMAHLEALHLLHNELQKKYFGYDLGYDYHVENKAIEWNTALWGTANVTFQPIEKSNIS